ncbi:MAG: transcription-repair coupling factor [Spirochaetales bacterium]|nr:transcription-repair coupling factor [Spirochaetales bacterium]
MITLFINYLDSILHDYLPYKKTLNSLIANKFPIIIEGADGFFRTFLTEKLASLSKGSTLVVTPTEKEAKIVLKDIQALNKNVFYFPGWENILFSGNKYGSNIAGLRAYYLSELLRDKKIIIVLSLKSLLTPVPPGSFFKNKLVTLKVGDSFDPIQWEEKLVLYGYLRVTKVTMPGEFSLKGEVLDIFPYGRDNAVRIVFEWDEIEEIKLFDPLSQKSSEKLKQITIYPATEILWDKERLNILKTIIKSGKDEIDNLEIKNTCKNEEFLFPAAFETPGSVVDYMSKNSNIVLIHKDRLNNIWETLKKETRELYNRARQEGLPCIEPDLVLNNYQNLLEKLNRKIIFPDLKDPDTSGIKFSYDHPRSFFGNINYLKEELTKLQDAGYKIVIFSESEIQALRIKQILKDFDLDVLPISISEGFSLPELKLIAIDENEIFGRRRRVPASVGRVQSKAIDTFIDLNPGDYVVHINYGIGRFKRIDRIKAAGTERDYIELEYSGEETIFIPIEQVNLVQKYIGKQGGAPALDLLGGKSWDTRKKKVRKSVEDLAEMLIDLYAKRKKARGYKFPEDSDWQLEFEAAFPFEETIDQLRCVEEVKADMESEQPMDRLICGDVGYGKTEIAMRAAFKAVVSGKQVAFLAPTTILAEQHYENFEERFKGYPVKVGMISRFVSGKEQKKIIEKTKNGSIDLLIGTHRIIQKDVEFKDLGLFIIDEEQRFGVKDKERLKKLKTSIDSLSLSATPIPRTLHMSLIKIRDMSVLETAPHSRRPIKTIIQEFDDEVIASAIRKEVARGGQVFFLHNRVETLLPTRIFLEKLLPELLIETAHGQMNSSQLEDVMHRFIHDGFHVLVATTIIENGIDIPNVNTIIIDRADMYGISQLYQLRGRVGRSDKRAYAYLMYPEKRSLSDIAMKRLSVISDHTELGSGFKIALKDLEIRGAGNLLGRQQHGEILSVGFDMYLRILDDAIAEMSDTVDESAPEVLLDLDYSGFIPNDYISNQSEKMEIYKKISSIQTDLDLAKIVSELDDRFGPLPDEVHSLLSISELRIICKKLFVSSLREKKGEIKITFSRVSIISVDKVLRMINVSKGSVRLDPLNPQNLIMQSDRIGLKDKSEFIREKLQSLV